MRKIHLNVKEKFLLNEWSVEERTFSDKTNRERETIFALANGYIGVRRMDLDNYNKNVGEGIHAACSGGAYQMLNGYGGMRVYDGKLHFRPFIESVTLANDTVKERV